MGVACVAWYYVWMVGSWRLAPDGNDNVRPMNIEGNFGPDEMFVLVCIAAVKH